MSFILFYSDAAALRLPRRLTSGADELVMRRSTPIFMCIPGRHCCEIFATSH